MTFNEKLINLRKQAGLSQDALARQLGVSRQAISKWELGTAMPETENIIRISKIFGVGIDWLLEHRVLIKPNNSINYQKTMKILFVVIYIMFVCLFYVNQSYAVYYKYGRWHCRYNKTIFMVES